LLVWVKNSLPPQAVRDKVRESKTFSNEFVAWLESCHQGGYSSGTESEIASAVAALSHNPTEATPAAPPSNMAETRAEEWLTEVRRITDCIVYLSNRHNSRHDKGCLRGKGPESYCRANFPRPLYSESLVDWMTGSVELRHTEQWLNTFNVTLTYLMRCNTDVTCLMSSTQVRAIIAYVTDYVTKNSLKTHVVFETIKAV
ncbi:hypothetical protein BDW22DRAFT_1297982, partial [Trametopsis cervina]